MRRPGYTLIELLAVVALLAAAAAAAIPVLVRAARRDPLAEEAGRLIRAEQALREAALAGAVVLEPGALGWRVRQGPRDADLALAGCLLTWTAADGTPLDRLAIDTHGRSADCVVTVRRGSAVARWSLAGLSGEWRREP